jgi:peptidoglycan/LPS O-acetylase OafA/YrhL
MSCFIAGPDGSAGDHIDDLGYLTRHVLNSVAALLIVAPAVFRERPDGLVRRALAWRPAVFVGTISYSVYLWHFAVFGQVARWWGGFPNGTAGWVAWTLAIVAGSLLLGAVSYVLIERPSMRLGRLIGRRLTRRDGPAVEELPVPKPVPAAGA